MIVLDEHLKFFNLYNLKQQIEKWYSGKVCYITELRPQTVIKDDNIAALLISQNQPTFVTINTIDFWKKIQAHKSYCIICFAIEDTRALEIPDILRTVLIFDEFKTKALRMGKVVRVSDHEIRFYTVEDKAIKRIAWK